MENSTEREAWQATVHGIAKSQTWLSDWAHTQLDSRIRALNHFAIGHCYWFGFAQKDVYKSRKKLGKKGRLKQINSLKYEAKNYEQTQQQGNMEEQDWWLKLFLNNINL